MPILNEYLIFTTAVIIKESIFFAAFKGLPVFLELNPTYYSFKSLKSLIYG